MVRGRITVAIRVPGGDNGDFIQPWITGAETPAARFPRRIRFSHVTQGK